MSDWSPARIAVGSGNRVKVAAVAAVAAKLWPMAQVHGVTVPSGVSDQPMGDDETIRGARERARGALAATEADLGVGLEGGCVELPDGGMRTCAWCVIVARDGREGVGGSLAMPLPASVAALVRRGVELGHAMDQVTGGRDTKTNAGAVGILTRGLIDRQAAYEVLVTYACVPWVGATPG